MYAVADDWANLRTNTGLLYCSGRRYEYQSGLIDLLLVLLIAWDWRARHRLFVFPIVLGAFVVQQGFWRDFALWFAQLPIT